jgi:hypothetical protein
MCKRKLLDTGRLEWRRGVPPHNLCRSDAGEPASVIMVPARDDDVGYVGFILVRELAGVAEGRF